MSRMVRIVLCGHPHHVVQRGHNRQATFADVPDYTRYLATLREYKVEYRVKVLAWCLMTNHVHLILVPGDKDGLGKLMKRLVRSDLIGSVGGAEYSVTLVSVPQV